MKEVVRVLENYSNSEPYIILDKPYYGTPTKFTNGIYVIEIMYCKTVNENKYAYNIRHLYNNLYSKITFPVGTVLTQINNPAIMLEVDGEYESVLTTTPNTFNKPLKIKQKIVEQEMPAHIETWFDRFLSDKPLYLEEELVPSQFFGLNNYKQLRQ